MRRKHTAEHENHERWLVSYADFITLLFAFFVVMFASTQADKAKVKAVSESIREALEKGQFSAALHTVLSKGKHENERTTSAQKPDAKTTSPGMPNDLAKSAETLREALKEELKAGKVAVLLEPRGLVISLREAGFFASGDDALSAASLPALQKIAGVVAALPNAVRLEGHTDSVPIHNSRFRSNWELSTARAIATLELLADRYKIAPARMAVVGYAENVPADSNETEAGRAHNRRVDLVLLATDAMRMEPVAAAPKTLSQTSSATRSPALPKEARK
jgi:chemotaxis protein MotB